MKTISAKRTNRKAFNTACTHVLPYLEALTSVLGDVASDLSDVEYLALRDLLMERLRYDTAGLGDLYLGHLLWGDEGEDEVV
jgi:hypothetical protein